MNAIESIKMGCGIIQKDVPLARYTSWKVGGTADILYRPINIIDLKNFLTSLEKGIPITWLGRGTNVLVRDGGVRGVVERHQEIRSRRVLCAAQFLRHVENIALQRLGWGGLSPALERPYHAWVSVRKCGLV